MLSSFKIFNNFEIRLKYRRASYLWIIVILLNLQSCICLKNVTLVPIPRETVENGTTTTLKCVYDLEGSALYMVQWSRGNRQVFRYTPSDNPKAKVFPIPGANVDVSLSNSSQLVLRWVDIRVSGEWSCEVTTESPSFSTKTSKINLNVIVASKENPVLWVGGKSKYDIGDILRANCTTGLSRPPANITFYVNQLPIGNDKGKSKVSEFNQLAIGQKDLFRSWGWLEMELTEFDLRTGHLVIECFTTIAGTNRKSDSRYFKVVKPEPTPQRVRMVTDNSSLNIKASTALLIMILSILSYR